MQVYGRCLLGYIEILLLNKAQTQQAGLLIAFVSVNLLCLADFPIIYIDFIKCHVK